MCGISGWIDWSIDLINQYEIIQKMNDSIIHRGPDDEGFWVSKHALFGHRRLIVVDAKGGKQPMIYRPSESKDEDQIVITYNGEVYNFIDIRKELQELGHSFKTRCDTEVVLKSYIEWGELCTSKFNGIFAFAVYDTKNSNLFIARDHIGVKPFFYSIIGNSIVFGSEMKVLLSNPLVKPIVNLEGFTELFALCPIRSPTCCVFRDIKELLPGHQILFKRSEDGCFTIKETVFWDLKSYPHIDDLETTSIKIKGLLDNSVSMQLYADVPLGSLLSGGLDSSGIVSIASERFKEERKTLDTFSVTFENDDKDFKQTYVQFERDEPYVQMVSKHCSTNHRTYVFDHHDLMENLYNAMRAQDLPSMGESEASLYLLSKRIKNNCTVVLSGETSDEIFSGYPWFTDKNVINNERMPWFESMNINFLNCINDDLSEKMDIPNFLDKRYKQLVSGVPHLDGEDPTQKKQRILSYIFLKHFVHFLLDRKDRQSMASGLEVRVPYCDYRIVDYCWNIPHKMKSVDDIEKGILRKALSKIGLLPHEVLYRKKSAYPQSCDNRYFYLLCDEMERILNNPSSPILKYIKTGPIKEIIKNKLTFNDPDKQRNLIQQYVQINQWLIDYKVQVILD